MWTPIRAILWEQWRRTRWALLIVFALSAAAMVICRLTGIIPNEKIYKTMENPDLWVRVFFLLAYVTWLPLKVEGAEIKVGLHRHAMTLPLPTFTLGAAQMLYGYASLAVLSAVLEGLAQVALGTGHWALPLLSVSVLSLTYALLWAGCVATPGLGLALQYSLFLPLFVFLIFRADSAPGFVLPLLPLIVLPASAIALWGLELERHGESAYSRLCGWLGIPGKSDTGLSAQKQALAPQALATQTAYEWKHTYRWMPILAVSCVGAWWIFCLCAVAGWGTVQGNYLVDLTGLLFWVLPWGLAAVVGIQRDTTAFSSYWYRQSIYTHSLPLHPRNQSRAMFRAGAKAIYITYTILWFLLLGFALATDSGNDIVRLLEDSSGIGMNWPLFWMLILGHILVSWVLLWLGWLIVPGLILFVLSPLAVPLAVFAGLLFIALLPSAMRKGDIQWKTFLAWPVVLAAVAALAAYLFPHFTVVEAVRVSSSGNATVEVPTSEVFALLLGSLIPFLPLATAPALLSRMRHR